MRCHEFESRLNDVLDARRNPAEDRLLAQHAHTCRDCRQLAAAMELVGESLRYADRTDLDEALAGRVLAQLATGSPPPSKHWSVGTHATLAAAAALLMMVVAPRMTSPKVDVPAVVTVRSVPPAAAVARIEIPQPAGPPVGQLAREATSRYASLVQSTSDSLSGVWSLWQLHAKVDDELPNATIAADVPKPLLADMAAGLRPLADSTTGAMSLLLELLPQGEPVPVGAPTPGTDPTVGQAAT